VSELNIPFSLIELQIIRKAAESDDMRPEMVVKRWARLGQMSDTMLKQGYEIVYRKGDEEVDPFDSGPKLAPMPKPTCAACEKSKRREWTEPEEHTCGLEQEQNSAWENEGGA